MEKIKIITDSTLDLPADLVREKGIEVLPLLINFGEESYLDGVEINTHDMLERIEKENILPTTAQVTPSRFEETFKNYTNYTILKKGNLKIPEENYYNDYLYINNNFNITLENSKNHDVLLNYKLEKKNNYADNETVGEVIVKIDNEVVHTEPIYVKKVETKKTTNKFIDWIKNLW